MRPADDLERRRLSDTCAALRVLPAQPEGTAALALRVRQDLADLGFAVDGDPAGAVPVSMLCRLDGPAAELPAGDAVVPSVVLGASLGPGAALLLAVAHRARVEPLPCGVELLFAVDADEPDAPLASPDARRLDSAYGFFLDHDGPVGELVTASPAAYRVEADFHRRPDAYRDGGDGAVLTAARTAIRTTEEQALEDSSASVSMLGDTPGPRDADHCRVVAAVHSLEQVAAEAAVAHVVDRCYDAGNDPGCACDVDVVVTRVASGLRHGAAQPAVRVAEGALRRCGHEPRRVAGERCGPADRLTAGGVWCVSLGVGPGVAARTEAQLGALLDVTLTLLDEAAA